MHLWFRSVIDGCRKERRTYGSDRTHLVPYFPWWKANCAHESYGSRSYVTNYSKTDSVWYAPFSVPSYHSPPHANGWNVHEAYIASFILGWNPGVCATSGAKNSEHGQLNGTTLGLLMNPATVCNIETHFGDTVVRGSWNVAVCIATLVLNPVSWFKGYWISLPHPSGIHCQHTEQPVLHLFWSVEARGTHIHLPLAFSPIPKA